MSSTFFSFLARMKYVNRWALMRNTFEEDLSAHSFEVAAIAHMLALIGNRRFGRNYNAERAAALGLYHDMPEILTGDLPTPVKYFNKEIVSAYAAVEAAATQRLLNALPEDLREELSPMFLPREEDAALRRLVKAADKIAAYIKTLEERRAGNTEFAKAEETTLAKIRELDLPEAKAFMDEFIPAFEMTLDQLSDE